MNITDKRHSLPLAFAFCVCVLLSACGGKTDNVAADSDSIVSADSAANMKTAAATDETLTDEEAEVNQEEEIVERVKEIYAAVKRRKTSADFVKLEQQYTTRAWRKALKAVSEKDAQSEDEVGFFDFDYWSMSQDDGDLKIKKVKVASIDAEKGVATVTLELHNYGTVTPLELSMRHEDDSWRINNFNSLLQEMDEYVKGK